MNIGILEDTFENQLFRPIVEKTINEFIAFDKNLKIVGDAELIAAEKIKTKDRLNNRIRDRFFFYINPFNLYNPQRREGVRDRHIIASSICGAVRDIKPINHEGNIDSSVNSLLAFNIGIETLRQHMLKDWLTSKDVTAERDGLKKDFMIKMPDIYDYVAIPFFDQVIGDLHHQEKYDVSGYARLFCKIEMYNKQINI